MLYVLLLLVNLRDYDQVKHSFILFVDFFDHRVIHFGEIRHRLGDSIMIHYNIVLCSNIDFLLYRCRFRLLDNIFEFSPVSPIIAGRFFYSHLSYIIDLLDHFIIRWPC